MGFVIFVGMWVLAAQGGVGQQGVGGATPVGLWRTIDDASGKASSDVRIYVQSGEQGGEAKGGGPGGEKQGGEKRGGVYLGRIERIYDAKDRDSVCDLCKDDRKDQKVLGMVVLRGIRLKDGRYEGGEILDPNTGTVYKCSFRLAENGKKLLVRGYVGFSLLGRTQTWERVE